MLQCGNRVFTKCRESIDMQEKLLCKNNKLRLNFCTYCKKRFEIVLKHGTIMCKYWLLH